MRLAGKCRKCKKRIFVSPSLRNKVIIEHTPATAAPWGGVTTMAHERCLRPRQKPSAEVKFIPAGAQV